MSGPVFLEGESIALHTVDRDDLEFLQRWRNHPDVRAGVTWAAPRNERQQEEWYESMGDDSVGLLICPQAGNAPASDRDPVGYVALFGIDTTHGHGEVVCWVTPEAQGEGYATDSTRTILRYAFEERRLHKVIARALVTNKASTRVFEKCGFQKEGHQRDEKFVDGEHVDVLRYATLADEWFNKSDD